MKAQAKEPASPPSGVDEKLLVEAAKRDPARFTELYELHFERVYAFVSRRVHRRPDAEDITAEVFHQALANLGRFEWRGVPFVAWLYRIAANAIADRWRALSRESGKPDTAVPSVELDDREIERTEQRAQVFRFVAVLPHDQRRVIEMRFGEGRSIREIAVEFGKSTGAIKQLQHRAFRKLQEQVYGVPRGSLSKRHG